MDIFNGYCELKIPLGLIGSRPGQKNIRLV
jgi:hypothetical protein